MSTPTLVLADFTDLIKLPDGDYIKPELIQQVYLLADGKSTCVKIASPTGACILSFDGDQREQIVKDINLALSGARSRMMMSR